LIPQRPRSALVCSCLRVSALVCTCLRLSALVCTCGRLPARSRGGGYADLHCGPAPMPPLTGCILWVAAVHPETIGPHRLAMLPRSNTSSCGAATTLRAVAHGRKGRRGGLCVHRDARCAPNAVNAPKCTQYTKCRHLSVVALILGARSPRTRPRARARARARAFVKERPPNSP